MKIIYKAKSYQINPTEAKAIPTVKNHSINGRSISTYDMNSDFGNKYKAQGLNRKECVYSIDIHCINGRPIYLSDFKNKKILFVNVASKCGFAKQYKELQNLSDQYKEQLVVIGSPCNQFGDQELGEASKIQEFYTLKYGITFLLTEKIDVKGKNQHPLYKWLTSKNLNGKKSSKVKWNFQKYLVSEKGELIDYYLPTTKPSGSRIIKLLKHFRHHNSLTLSGLFLSSSSYR